MTLQSAWLTPIIDEIDAVEGVVQARVLRSIVS